MAVGAAVVVGGAALVGGGFKGMQSWAGGHISREHKEQAQVLSDLLLRSGVRPPTNFNFESHAATHDGLLTPAPAYPQIPVCFDTILKYQESRMGKEKRAIRMIKSLGGVSSHDEPSDPKTAICELLKAWLREQAENRDIVPEDILAYRDFCRGMIPNAAAFGGQRAGKITIIEVMGHCAKHLDEILTLRLKETRSAAELIARLRKESYSFILQGIKVPLLTGMEAASDSSFYSLESLNIMRQSRLPPAMITGEFERRRAAKVQQSWQTDCGRLIGLMLASPHVSRLCDAHEGVLQMADTVQMACKIVNASNLPVKLPFQINAPDPYVRARLLRGDEEIGRLETGYRTGDSNPVWNEILLFDIPLPSPPPGSASASWAAPRSVPALQDAGGDGPPLAFHFEIGDWSKTTGGKVGNRLFAQKTIALDSAMGVLGTELNMRLDKVQDKIQLDGAKLCVRFAQPDFRSEVASLAERWQQGGGAAERASGLKFPGLGEHFLLAMDQLEQLAYFYDVVLNQCGEIARILGDFGIAIVAPVLHPLAQEAIERTHAAAEAVDKLIEAVYGGHAGIVDAARAGQKIKAGNAGAVDQAGASAGQLRELRSRSVKTLSEIQDVCSKYKDLGDAQQEGLDALGALFQAASSTSMKERSTRITEDLLTRAAGRFIGDRDGGAMAIGQ